MGGASCGYSKFTAQLEHKPKIQNSVAPAKAGAYLAYPTKAVFGCQT